MDRLNEYRQIVVRYLEDFAKNDANAQLVFDRDRDRYIVLHNEWRGDRRIYGCAIQLDIIDDRVWIQINNTEIYVDRELIDLGVDSKDIILGFRSPNIRKLLAADRH
jgi:squalene cyclase